MADVKALAADLVRRLGATEAGRRIGVSRQMAAAIATGARQPSAKVAAALEAATESAPPPKSPREKMPPGKTTLEELRATIDDIDATLDDDIPATAKASLYRARIDALQRISVLRGEQEITMAVLVRSRVWRELLTALGPVLERHPDAAAEIADVLERLEGP